MLQCAPSRRVDLPSPGYFKLRLARGAHFQPAQIECDRGYWSAIVSGERMVPCHQDWTRAAGVEKVWLSGRFIDRLEYEHLLALIAWARANDRDHPILHPFRKLDINQRAVESIIPKVTT